MDELNQMQNPMSPPTGGQPMGQAPMPAMPPQMPQMPVQPMPAKGKSMLLWIIIVIAVVAAGAAWWYINQMAVEPLVKEPVIDREAREDRTISNEIQGTDSVNIDAEFKTVDQDINSL